MKKLFALLLALCMIFALAACGQQAAPADTPAEAEAPAGDGSLVGVAMPTKDLQRWNQDGENMPTAARSWSSPPSTATPSAPFWPRRRKRASPSSPMTA